MNGNRFGTIFQITTWGESHGPASGVVIDGCPSGLPLHTDDFIYDMKRRQGGGSTLTTPRQEPDLVQIESGVFEGKTTGTPIALRIANVNTNSADYDEFRDSPRPGHADLTTLLKQGRRDHRGGGRSSARETAARVAAGTIAKKVLAIYSIELLAWVNRVGAEGLPNESALVLLNLGGIQSLRDGNSLGLPLASVSSFEKQLSGLREKNDSLGGSVFLRVDHLPAGVGEPVFDKLNALLAHAFFSLPAVTAVEIGGGRPLSEKMGSEIRDPIGTSGGRVQPLSNRHGGILGGMSTGLPLSCTIAFHAPTSVAQPIDTWDYAANSTTNITVSGRHDAFPLPRAIPMVEAMAAITLTDLLLRAGRIPEKL